MIEMLWILVLSFAPPNVSSEQVDGQNQSTFAATFEVSQSDGGISFILSYGNDSFRGSANLDPVFSDQGSNTSVGRGCHYHSVMADPMWISLSDCDGHFRGMIGHGTKMLTLHYETPSYFVTVYTNGERKRRKSRDANRPVYIPEDTRVADVLIVVDATTYRNFNREERRIQNEIARVFRNVNEMYESLFVRLSPSQIVFWKDGDLTQITSDPDTTLKSFCYSSQASTPQNINFNHKMLLSGIPFRSGSIEANIMGRAYVGGMCSRSSASSCSVIHFETSKVDALAFTIAHEVGHTFGMSHDEDSCSCSSATCVMAPFYQQFTKTWSSCSKQQMREFLRSGKDDCLSRSPTRYSPVCGNNILDDGEDCDIANACCDSSTCKFAYNAQCATGQCCDLASCTMKYAGNECRRPQGECDLPEYCDGKSEFCPMDGYRQDGSECNYRQSYCIRGQCPPSRYHQCQQIWGPGSENGEICYEENAKTGRDCGYCQYVVDEPIGKEMPCEPEDVLCGVLFCHTNSDDAKPQNPVSKSWAFMKPTKNGDSKRRCRGVRQLLNSTFDVGMVRDGTECGENKMCLGRKCVRADSLPKSCRNSCPGHGVCDSTGECVCERGYLPPDCVVRMHGRPPSTVRSDRPRVTQTFRPRTTTDRPGQRTRTTAREDPIRPSTRQPIYRPSPRTYPPFESGSAPVATDESGALGLTISMTLLFVVLPLLCILSIMVYYALNPYKKITHLAIIKEKRDVWVVNLKEAKSNVTTKMNLARFQYLR